MNQPLPRAALERFGRLLQEYGRRHAKSEQSKRGYYDDQGIRQGGLIAFVRYFWHILEPETPLVDGWPLWVICEHLEAVTAGEITRLLMNVPPGFMKSLLTDVFWPAWEWGPMSMPHLRYVAFSYASSLTERDNERFGVLVNSDEYQVLYREQVALMKKGEKKVSNRKRGWKLASSVGGVGTGERGDRVILDDPHNVKEIESDTVRQETVRWFRESMSDRLNSLTKGVIVIIMQRVHEDDVSGVIMSVGFDYCVLRIPMEFEWSTQVDDDGQFKVNQLGWVDPRFIEDEPDECDRTLAWEDRFPPEAVNRIKFEKGPYAWAGQYQQSPSPRGGGIFHRDWWQLWEPNNGKFPVFEFLMASLDSSFTEKEENDPSGLTIWGVFKNDEGKRRIMLVHAWRKHLQFSGPRIEYLPRESAEAYRRRTMKTWGLIEWTADTCRRFRVDRLLIEAKASGISAAQELRNRYPREDWATQLVPVSGDKVARALAAQPTFSQLLVYAPARDWSDMVIDEMAVFPKGKYKDLTDSATQAIKYLRDAGMARTDDETHASDMDNVRHRPKLKAVYPV